MILNTYVPVTKEKHKTEGRNVEVYAELECDGLKVVPGSFSSASGCASAASKRIRTEWLSI